ncbi:thioredoxin family protein [Candidatus Roizmanbacteria bacterium]|nr:thioredoxin family protein [Candidatus Roizmanbacteria bacterium]
MKPFNIFIAISLIVILGGFVFFKDGFNRAQSKSLAQTELRMDTPGYLTYSDATLANTQLKGKSVLFFAATTWCQTCLELEKEIIERQAEIPEGVTILKVDYDNDKAMNQKYGVTSQHTLVVLNKDGQEVKRWLGGGFDTLLQQIKEI